MPRPAPPRQTSAGAVSVREIVVDHVGGQGDGVADGPLYLPFTLPGERVSARVRGQQVGGQQAGGEQAGDERAEVVAVLQPSADRVAPPCPHFGACGGCALQHWAHAPYLAWKIEQLRLALGRAGLEAEFAAAFAAAPGSRRRLALHARRGSRDAARLGFKARRSWTLVDVAACSIADPRLVAAFPALARFAAPLLEHPQSAPTLHVTLSETGLDVAVTGVEAKAGGLSAEARRRAAEAAASAGFARATLNGEGLYLARAPLVRFGRAAVALPPGGFLQAVAAAEAAMAAFIVEALDGAGRVADLFCGSGAFAFPLAERAGVLAIDSAEPAVRALAGAAGSVPGLKAVAVEARDLARRPLLAADMKRLDAVVFDPPRAGAAEQAAQIAASAVPRAVAVSCNPVTFARDAAILVEGGFRLQLVLPVDQFLWSPHIELVGVFTR